ncbi:MAG: DUF4168 domain-containing protein [Spirochaetaceae bacterium]|nr:DUF4168 domain-containing protein [Spirochaetaceae bacterium]MCF7947341.1 DUF4168 domain-containing protein [Spirochaetia bacterium]MCF7950567.1 DUF4168 domain-containing protein [Spirochaetaceae bacterium]
MLFNFIRKGSAFISIAALLTLAILPVAAQSGNTGQSGSQLQQGQSENSPAFEDQELEKFADVMEEIQAVQTESNQKMESAFSGSSMSKERFNTLYSARQKQGKQKADNETDAETEEFNALAQKIQSIQQSSQKKMVETVRANDMTVQKFNAIVKAMRSNPELGQRIQQLM